MHPAGARLTGQDQVRESWAQDLRRRAARARAHRAAGGDQRDDARGAQRARELLRSPGKPQAAAAPIVATNVYLRTAAGWRMIVHHASPAPAQPQRRRRATPRRRSCIEMYSLSMVAARRPPADDLRRAAAAAARRARSASAGRRPTATSSTSTSPATPRRRGALVLFHGLEGSADSHYARAIAAHAAAKGWRVAHRRTSAAARASRTASRAPITPATARRSTGCCESSAAPLYAVGVSLGGNALLKWLGERGDEAQRAGAARRGGVGAARPRRRRARARPRAQPRALHAALPVDAEAQVARQAGALPGLYDAAQVRAARTLPRVRRRGDRAAARLSRRRRLLERGLERAVARAHPRADAVTQRAQRPVPAGACAARRGAQGRAERGARISAHGGHVGFVAGPFPGRPWLPQRLLEFLDP